MAGSYYSPLFPPKFASGAKLHPAPPVDAARLAMKVMASMNVPSAGTLAHTGQQPSARPIVIVTVVVLLIHVLLFAIMLNVRDEPEQKPLASRTITAELISAAPQPVATPVALQSLTPPEPVPPKPHQKPHPAIHRPTPKPAPAPMIVSDAPSQYAPPTLAEPAPPAPEAPPATATAPSAPAIGRETLAISAPKNVSHLDCNIAKPDYPYASKRLGETGTTIVHFVVGLTGHIEDIHLQKSSGYERLDNAALDAMHDSACHPYLDDGKPIRAAYSQPFTFSLTN